MTVEVKGDHFKIEAGSESCQFWTEKGNIKSLISPPMHLQYQGALVHPDKANNKYLFLIF